MKSIIILALVAVLLLAAGVAVKNYKEQARAALGAADAAAAAAREAAGAELNGQRAGPPGSMPTFTALEKRGRIETTPAPPPSSTSALRRLLAGEAPTASSETASRQSLQTSGRPNLARLLEAEEDPSSR